MTNTYLIRAWCDRRFITQLYPVEAETPEAAIAIARRQPTKLLDAAEECNGNYAWDEFAACDEDGNALLHVLDEEARLQVAARELLEALEYAYEVLAKAYDGDTVDIGSALQPCADAIATAGATTRPSEQAAARLPIVTVSVRGGLIEDLDATIPLTVVVEDWDVPNEEAGEKPTQSVYSLAGEAARACGSAIAKRVPAAVNAMGDLPPPFDAYEIHGVREFGRGKSQRCEQVADGEAHFWSLYGHIAGQGLECIGDFKSRELAEEIYARITGEFYADR
ncbi:MAG: hypothetical protein AB7I48_02275 [Planctomycetaceae bacterium]